MAHPGHRPSRPSAVSALLEGVEASAVLSECGTYRYRLERTWDPSRRAVGFVMLNPSTADAETDDPTLRRCQSFARAWGYGRLVVVNLYALRSTDPKALWKHPDPVGPDNGWHLGGGLLREPDVWNYADLRPERIVAAWGANARREEVDRFRGTLRNFYASAYCLGTTKDGHPRHPLYVRGDTPLQPWYVGR